MKIPSRETVERIRRKYPAGTRLVADSMNDPQAPKPGELGTVTGTDDLGDLLMSWDSGGSLKLILETDSFHIASAEEEALAKLKRLAGRQPQERCPRCGAGVTPTNRLLAVSRRLDITICEACGTIEGLEDAGMVDKIPLTEWAAVTEDWE